MKRIGIITYHRSQNYGAQLQACATRIVLEQMGCQAEVIDCNRIGEEKKLFHWHTASLKALLGSARNNVLSLISERSRRRKFAAFSRDCVGRSTPCHTRKALEEKCRQYDAVITGSDQVWHPQICEGRREFFLDLPLRSEQKIAYAPSFGVSEYTEDEVAAYMPLINDIAHLSVREHAGQELILRHTGRYAPLVVDPTMLLTATDWNRLATPTPYQHYLLYFTILDEPSGLDAAVRRLAARRNLKIVRIGLVKDIIKPGFINARAAGPQEFLGLVRDADLVVTSSFHGTVFSILYEKNFICVLNNNNRNSRLETLVRQLGLEKRLVRDAEHIDVALAEQEPDYTAVAEKLQYLRAQSLHFLQQALS